VTRDEFEASVMQLWVTTAIPLTRANLQCHSGESSRRVKQWLKELMSDGVLAVASNANGDLEWTVVGAKRPADGPRTFDEKERLQRLSNEVALDLESKQAANAARREQAVAAKHEQLALLKASKREQLAMIKTGDKSLAVEDEDEDEDDNRPGLLSRLRQRFSAGDAIDIASEARSELDEPRKKKEKSLLWSGGLSLLLGPLGWLYAGSFRESIPAAAVYMGVAAIVPKILLMPVLGIALPISGIAGLVYAWQYNRAGKRCRILGKDDKKALKP
jgi:hypothetical protein